MQRNQQGFTLIELVIVIVILGILSAFALPRFADLGGDARVASLEGAAGAMRSAASISRSAQLAGGGDLDDPVTLEGQEITMVAGAPTADQAGIGVAAQLSDDYTLEGGGATEDDTLQVLLEGFDATDDCRVDYTSGTSDDDGIDTPASVTVFTTDC